MSETRPITILCLASYHKGDEFLVASKTLGCRVLLLTRESLKEEAWPRESIDELLFMPNLKKQPDMTYAVSYRARSQIIDQIIPLDDYDVLTAAALREHLRLPGLGESLARLFRDKLAMRVQARAAGLLVPDFAPVFNYDRLREFMAGTPPPWVLKPRSEAGAMGIKKLRTAEELWRRLDTLGDEQSFFVLEKYVPGDVYHVDAIVSEGEVVFSAAHKYGRPPMNVAHEGGVFISRTLPYASEEAQALQKFNRQLLKAFGLVRGAAHAEFIRGAADGRFYFLETAARVGGANIADMVKAASGVNLWAEWAKVEVAHLRREPYPPPQPRQDYAGILICLARQPYPDLSAYQDPEIVWRMTKEQHAGLIIASSDPARIETLLDRYSERFASDFLAVAPPLDKPPD